MYLPRGVHLSMPSLHQIWRLVAYEVHLFGESSGKRSLRLPAENSRVSLWEGLKQSSLCEVSRLILTECFAESRHKTSERYERYER